MSNAKMWTFGLLPMLLILLMSDSGVWAQYKPGTSFDGKQGGSAEVCPSSGSFMSEKDVNDLITEMLRRISAKNRFIVVSCSRVDNCQAVIYGGKPYILFNPEFLGSVRRLNFSSGELPTDMKSNDWATLTILAHEIGHHINNHISNPPPDVPQRDLELEADEFAGSMIARMGATKEQAFLAYASLSENGNYNHPDRKSRLQAIEKGWMTVSPVPSPVNPQPSSEKREELIEQQEQESCKQYIYLYLEGYVNSAVDTKQSEARFNGTQPSLVKQQVQFCAEKYYKSWDKLKNREGSFLDETLNLFMRRLDARSMKYKGNVIWQPKSYSDWMLAEIRRR